MRGTIVDCYIVGDPVALGLLCIVQEGEAIVGGKVVKAGQAIFVAANGDVTGPFTPDGQFYAVAGVMPFPLFGQDLGEVVKHLDIGDSTEDIIDQIKSDNGPPPSHDEPLPVVDEPPATCATDPSLCPATEEPPPTCEEGCECTDTCDY